MGSPGKLGAPTVSTIKRRIWITPAHQDPRAGARFSLTSIEKEKAIVVIGAERNAKAERWAEAVLVSS